MQRIWWSAILRSSDHSQAVCLLRCRGKGEGHLVVELLKHYSQA